MALRKFLNNKEHQAKIGQIRFSKNLGDYGVSFDVQVFEVMTEEEYTEYCTVTTPASTFEAEEKSFDPETGQEIVTIVQRERPATKALIREVKPPFIVERDRQFVTIGFSAPGIELFSLDSINLEDNNPIKAAYLYLKSHSIFFADWEDC